MFQKKAEKRKEKLKIIEMKNKQEGQNGNREKIKTISPTDSRGGVLKISTLVHTPVNPTQEAEPAWSTHIK